MKFEDLINSLELYEEVGTNEIWFDEADDLREIKKAFSEAFQISIQKPKTEIQTPGANTTSSVQDFIKQTAQSQPTPLGLDEILRSPDPKTFKERMLRHPLYLRLAPRVIHAHGTTPSKLAILSFSPSSVQTQDPSKQLPGAEFQLLCNLLDKVLGLHIDSTYRTTLVKLPLRRKLRSEESIELAKLLIREIELSEIKNILICDPEITQWIFPESDDFNPDLAQVLERSHCNFYTTWSLETLIKEPNKRKDALPTLMKLKESLAKS
ncbi:hypothetical protein OAA91_00320 [Fibrobacterales bacterium]|nr:hypothetical protein [Fibrobacterales bacterium]